MPLEVLLNIQYEKKEDDEEEMEIIDWEGDAVEEYYRWLEARGRVTTWGELKAKISNALRFKKVKKKKKKIQR